MKFLVPGRPFAAAIFALAMAAGAGAWRQPATLAQQPTAPGAAPVAQIFETAAVCMTCHNGLVTPSGEDISFGTAWQSSMMAHSALDPYWQAGVRREIMDHPSAQAAIETECSRCHMPMAHVQAMANGETPSVFANVPHAAAPDPMAIEGVSCSVCHQITSDRLGQPDSFTGHFAIDTTTPLDERRMFGPYSVDQGRTALMRSATGFVPTTAPHIQQSELCATCHTLYTRSLDEAGKPLGEFPEQVPFQEWLESDYRDTESCQSCHMPVVDEPTEIASVLGEPREDVSRHTFRGANFFMLGVLNRFRADLGVVARPAELTGAVAETKAFLQTSAATVEVTRAARAGSRLEASVVVRSLAGHKLPTAYPSRRAWLAVTVTDAQGNRIFASGLIGANGAIEGNDNDRDGSQFEPHYREIRSPDEVQIYESIMGTPTGAVTTGLLSAVSYLKDNRILPRGFDKTAAPSDVAVHGGALGDPDFIGGQDEVQYSIDLADRRGPFIVSVQLWYQPIAFRWAQNLRAYDAFEPRRFVGYWDEMGSSSALVLARTTATVE
jgi:hypothetical protein